MKTITFIITLLPAILFAQEYTDTIITTDHDTVYCKIRSVGKSSINYLFNDNGSKSIGSINTESVLRYSIDEPDVEPTEEESVVIMTSGGYLISARKNMLFGLTIASLGSIVGGVMVSNPDQAKSAAAILVASGILGIIFNIVGVVHIGKSGKKHNEESGNK